MINLDSAHPTGWLVPPDDLDTLADTLVEAVNGPGELGHRGDAALAYARAELTWSSRVAGFEPRTARSRTTRHRRLRLTARDELSRLAVTRRTSPTPAPAWCL